MIIKNAAFIFNLLTNKLSWSITFGTIECQLSTELWTVDPNPNLPMEHEMTLFEAEKQSDISE